MCGIAGLTGRRDPVALQAMLGAIAHRGPDDEGQSWVDTGGRWVGLGNRRLAILDVSAGGHQPMEADRSVLAYNGEVYNFAELRHELEGCGTRFQSGSDTEVVLQVLRRDGSGGLGRLNGMFALAFWDADRGELVLARDRFGIKPLYYRCTPEGLVFASEAKCLFAAGPPAELDMGALGSFLSFGWVPGPRTLYRDVVELPPGHLLRWRAGAIQVERFRDTVPAPEPAMGPEAAAQAVQDSLRRAVRRHMVADVPVGVLLSGGLDSSAIAALVAAEADEPVRAYTIAFRRGDARLEQSADDARCARLVADRFHLDLEEFEVSSDVAGLLEDVAWHLDDPVADPAAILTLIICRAAAAHVKVLLSGHGSDELFGGYRVHGYDRIAERLLGQPEWLRRAATKSVDALPGIAGHLPARGPGLVLAAHRASRNILDNLDAPPEERYVGYRAAYYFGATAMADLLTPEARRQALAHPPWAVHLGAFDEVTDLPFFDRMLHVDHRTFLVNQNLAYSDRLSMAASVEMRVPFLDDEVADLALRIPESLKMRRLRGKEVLRRAMKGIVPDEVIRRRKAAFAAPVRSWLRSELAPLVRDVLSDRWLTGTGLFEPAAVHRLLDEHQSARADHTYRIWTLLTFAMWHTAHIAPRDRRG